MDSSKARIARVRRLIEEQPTDLEAAGTSGRLQQLCSTLAGTLPASGAGISLMTEDQPVGAAAASDARSLHVEGLQFTYGEGPCLDAFASRRPALEPDLAGAGARRWPGYAPAALEHGIRAVFAFPLQVGAARLGVLDVYRAEAGSLSPADVTEALTFAEIAVSTLLDGQSDARANELAVGLDDVLAGRVEVYQAQGLVMVQLGVSLSEAMARLRAYAFANDRYLSDVAHDVVAGTLVLDKDEL